MGPSQGTKLAELEGVRRIGSDGLSSGRDPGQLLPGPASPEVPADDGGISAGRDGGLLPAPGSRPAARVPRPGPIDQWLAWFHLDPARISGASGEESPDRDDMAVQGFLHLLGELRTISSRIRSSFGRNFPGIPCGISRSSRGRTTRSLLAGCSNAWRSARRPTRSSCSRPFPLVTDRLTISIRRAKRPRPNARPSRPNPRWPRPNSRGSTRGSTT
jgi:hypothetical protein